MVQSRRRFLNLTLLSSVVFLSNGCDIIALVTPKETLRLLQEDLLPITKELGINTAAYMEVVFAHERVDAEQKELLKRGVKELGELAHKEHKRHFTHLSRLERHEIIGRFVAGDSGAAFVDAVLRFTLEALLGDPIYGSNIDQAGWRWLGYEAAIPQPKKAYL